MKAYKASMPQGDVLDYVRAPINLFSNSMAGLGAEMLGKGKQFEEKYGYMPKTKAEMDAVEAMIAVMGPGLEAMDYLKIPPIVGPNTPTIAAAMQGVDRAAARLTADQAKKAAANAGQAVKKAATSDDMAYAIENLAQKAGFGPKQIMMGPMSKTWRKADADLAVQMESEGRSANDIWRKTGTFRAPDGRLRQEIPDIDMRYTGNAVERKQYENAKKRYEQAKAKATTTEELNDANDYWNRTKTNAIFNLTGKAPDFVNHPELFAAYPELAKYSFKQLEPTHNLFTAPETVQGFYRPIDKRITINTDAPYKRSTALHELQHAIQELEGWQGGSSPDYVAAKMAERDVAKKEAKEIQDRIDNMKAMDPILYEDLIKNEESALGARKYLLNQTEPLEGATDPYDVYKKMSGEEEARMVQARRDYDERSRRDSLPIWNYETPPSEQITKDFAGGGEVHMNKGGILGRVAKTAEKGMEKAAKAARVAPQDEAMRLAQQRAALPPSQGGLGLPADNTPMQRATAMGFIKDTYHGALRNIKRLDPRKGSTESHAGQGVYSTDSPRDASQNYASAYGPDVYGKINRSMNEQEKEWKRTRNRLWDESLTPRQQEILLSNTLGADNIGVVYPLKVRSDKSIHLDRPEKNPIMVGPFEQYDEAADSWSATPHAPTFDQALAEYSGRGGETGPIINFAIDYGGGIPARDLFNAVKKQGAEDYLYDPHSGELISGGVAAADFLKHFGIDEIRHTPKFNNRDLNIAGEHIISLNPDNVRSRFAAFDPWRKDAATAAAFGVVAPDLLAQEQEPEKKLTIDEFLKRMKER
jgi:hypothetical protein